jgi:hypothetical protein
VDYVVLKEITPKIHPMDTRYLLLILCWLFSYAESQGQSDPYQPFSVGNSYPLLVKNVNVRSEALPDASIISNLPIGSEVKILDMGGEHTLKGIAANWYKVSFQVDGQMREGFIWGGLIASGKITCTSNPGVDFLFGISKSTAESEHYDRFWAQIRAVKDNKELSKLEFPTPGSRTTPWTLEMIENHGLEGLKEVIVVSFSDGFCGGAFGHVYLGWTGKDWVHVISTSDGFDAPYAYQELLLFPNDEGGKPGKIVLVAKSNEEAVESEEENVNEGDEMKEIERIEYDWEGKTLQRRP